MHLKQEKDFGSGIELQGLASSEGYGSGFALAGLRVSELCELKPVGCKN